MVQGPKHMCLGFCRLPPKKIMEAMDEEFHGIPSCSSTLTSIKFIRSVRYFSGPAMGDSNGCLSFFKSST